MLAAFSSTPAGSARDSATSTEGACVAGVALRSTFGDAVPACEGAEGEARRRTLRRRRRRRRRLGLRGRGRRRSVGCAGGLRCRPHFNPHALLRVRARTVGRGDRKRQRMIARRKRLFQDRAPLALIVGRSRATLVSPLCTLTCQPGEARPAITPSPLGSITTTSKVGTTVGAAGGERRGGPPASASAKAEAKTRATRRSPAAKVFRLRRCGRARRSFLLALEGRKAALTQDVDRAGTRQKANANSQYDGDLFLPIIPYSFAGASISSVRRAGGGLAARRRPAAFRFGPRDRDDGARRQHFARQVVLVRAQGMTSVAERHRALVTPLAAVIGHDLADWRLVQKQKELSPGDGNATKGELARAFGCVLKIDLVQPERGLGRRWGFAFPPPAPLQARYRPRPQVPRRAQRPKVRNQASRYGYNCTSFHLPHSLGPMLRAAQGKKTSNRPGLTPKLANSPPRRHRNDGCLP